MEPPGWNWPAIAALATVAVTAVTVAYAVATCFFIRSGFRKMNQSSDERAADRQRAWAALEAEQRRRDGAMTLESAPGVRVVTGGVATLSAKCGRLYLPSCSAYDSHKCHIEIGPGSLGGGWLP